MLFFIILRGFHVPINVFTVKVFFCIILRGFHVPIHVLTVKGVFCIILRGFHVPIHLFHCQRCFLYNRQRNLFIVSWLADVNWLGCKHNWPDSWVWLWTVWYFDKLSVRARVAHCALSPALHLPVWAPCCAVLTDSMHDDWILIFFNPASRWVKTVSFDCSWPLSPWKHVYHYLTFPPSKSSLLLCCHALAGGPDMEAPLGLFARNIKCDVLIGWSCSVDWQPGNLYCHVFESASPLSPFRSRITVRKTDR